MDGKPAKLSCLRPGPGARSALTLIELLVVVAVISVLVSLLVPSLNRAREQAKGLRCCSNLRQLAVAAHAYAGSYRDRYPIAQYLQTGPVRISFAWDFTTEWHTEAAAGEPVVTPGLLWAHTGADEVQQCPTYEGGANWLSDPYSGYNYNTSFIGHGRGEWIAAPALTSQVRTPARTALFGDGRYRGGANKFMRAPWAEVSGDLGFSGRFAGTQGFCHSGKTNVAFADGHAEAWADLYTDTYAHEQRGIAPETGFLSADNALYDLK